MGSYCSYGSTYEEAVANPTARTGKSPIFIADTANRTTALEGISGLVAASFRDRPFRGFVIAVPEPSTGVLILAGVGAVVVVIRVKRGKRAVGRDERGSFFGNSPGSESGRGLPHSKTCRT